MPRLPYLAGLGLLLLASPHAMAQDTPGDDSPPAPAIELVVGQNYRVYRADGTPSTLNEIVERSLGEDVLLVGEEHGDLVGHRIEDVLFRALADTLSSSGRPLVLSLEMFERDVQFVVDEYLAGLITENHFLDSSRPWTDYDVRYRALVETALGADLPVVAANAPRRYVNRVTRSGAGSLQDLPPTAKAFLPPLPYPLASRRYRAQWDSLMVEFGGGGGTHDEEAGERTLQAQALWDASMGHSITEALVEHLGALVVHYAGSFHVERGTGIPERIADYRPGSRVTAVVMRAVEDVEGWRADEHEGLGDFVILTLQADTEAAGGGDGGAG